MIGQKKLLQKIDKTNYIHRSTLLVGNRGSEQKEIVKYIADKFNFELVIIDDISVDNIRNIIDNVYTVNSNVLYAILNADDMSIAAKNSILKIIEEPINNARFIFCLEDIDNTLYTIRSRSVIYYVDSYSYDELLEYYKTKTEYKKEDEEIICKKICSNIGDIDKICSIDAHKFYDYVQTVYQNIDKVSGSNCFKIADKIALKNEPDKYDLRLLWNTFVSICYENRWIDVEKMYAGVFVTFQCTKKLKNKSINKQMLFDDWILNIRAEWKCLDE